MSQQPPDLEGLVAVHMPEPPPEWRALPEWDKARRALYATVAVLAGVVPTRAWMLALDRSFETEAAIDEVAHAVTAPVLEHMIRTDSWRLSRPAGPREKGALVCGVCPRSAWQTHRATDEPTSGRFAFAQAGFAASAQRGGVMGSALGRMDYSAARRYPACKG